MNHGLRNFILLALMLAASGMAAALCPTHKIADQGSTEICYPAQGVVPDNKQAGTLALNKGSNPVTRTLTSVGQRIEPVTYWTTIANQAAKSDTNKRFIQLSYAPIFLPRCLNRWLQQPGNDWLAILN